MGFAHRALVAAGAGFAASVIVGCGSSGGSWLSASQSSNLNQQLNRVMQALDSGNCARAQQYLADFQSSVDNMGGINSTLVSNLDQGVSTIQSLANNQCRTVVTTPKRTHTKTTTSSTTTTTQTPTFTNPSTTQTYSTPTYTTPVYSTSTTSTTGGTCPTCYTTTTAGTPSTTTPSGGGGLGGSTDTSTGGDTTTTTGPANSGGSGF